MNRLNKILIRATGVVILAGLAAVLLAPPIAEKRESRRVKAMLLQVQAALQNYHVDEEIYPRRMMPGAELIQFLQEKKSLETPPENPWSGGPYAEGSDWLRYRTDQLAETYELIVVYPETEYIQFRLDSTENQSLE